MDEQPRRVPVLDLICPPQTDMLRLIRSVVATVSQELGFSAEEAGLIELAVDEACTNVIVHAYGEMDEARKAESVLRVQIRAASDRLAIQVIDTGSGLPEGRRGVDSLEEYTARPRPSGLGSFIITHFMDEVAYDSPEGSGSGTVLSMVKYLRPAYG